MKTNFTFLILLLPILSIAEPISFDFGESGPVTSRILQMIALVTILSIAPSILVMITSFTRMVVVFSFLRSAMGLQQSPPNSVLISLALFLTAFVMSGPIESAYKNGINPLINEKISETEAFELSVKPFSDFMFKNVRTKDLELFIEMANLPEKEKAIKDPPLHVLTPAFMISELRQAFLIGFVLFLPFIIIDLIIASVLMAMGMMMLPPVMISMPFKIIFFVVVDGWYIICGSLVKGFVT